jgi:beta-glucosidase-like glycosyl hydrolase
MDMKAISANFPSEEAAALALRGGVDVLLFCHELVRAVEVFEALYELAENDPALRAKIDASYGRITALKQRFLVGFSGLPGAESLARLKGMHHQLFLNRLYGSL